jgi:hypothetical protein
MRNPQNVESCVDRKGREESNNDSDGDPVPDKAGAQAIKRSFALLRFI